MIRLLKEAALILVLAGLWAAGGYFTGAALETIGFDAYRWGIILAALNVILGMSLFLGVTKDPAAERIFFRQAKPDDIGYAVVGCLWLLPLLWLIFGVSMWFWALVLRLIFPK